MVLCLLVCMRTGALAFVSKPITDIFHKCYWHLFIKKVNVTFNLVYNTKSINYLFFEMWLIINTIWTYKMFTTMSFQFYFHYHFCHPMVMWVLMKNYVFTIYLVTSLKVLLWLGMCRKQLFLHVVRRNGKKPCVVTLSSRITSIIQFFYTGFITATFCTSKVDDHTVHYILCQLSSNIFDYPLLETVIHLLWWSPEVQPEKLTSASGRDHTMIPHWEVSTYLRQYIHSKQPWYHYISNTWQKCQLVYTHVSTK